MVVGATKGRLRSGYDADVLVSALSDVRRMVLRGSALRA